MSSQEKQNTGLKIAGNAPDAAKQRVARGFDLIAGPGTQGFGAAIAKRLHLTEVDVREKAEEPAKQEARVVCELEVRDDMLNTAGSLHGGCSAWLVDLCSSLPLGAINKDGSMGVSQAINMVYHAPAPVGAKLKIASTTMTVGARVMSARCEIWDATHHRLVASGVHVKMDASPPKKAKL